MVEGQNDMCAKLKNLYVKKEARQDFIRGDLKKNHFYSNHSK
jgi:hypothetical protein